MQLQHQFYNSSERPWIWSGTEPITRLLFYDGIKGALISLWLYFALLLLLHRRLPRLGAYVRGIRIVLLSLILVPATIAGLKAATNAACPRDLQQFGGDFVYAKLFRDYPAHNSGAGRQQCFPTAHASTGFALLSLFLLFKSRRNRRRAIYASLAIGWSMGLYKIVIGDHFLSHTIVSMLLAWVIINGIGIMESRWHTRRCAAPVTSGSVSDLEFQSCAE